jgi:membrane-associated phospholipid phosphatase
VKAILRNNIAFLYPYYLFLLCGAVLLMMNTKADIHLEFNAFHSPFFNSFFFYFTYLGDGWTVLIVFVMLLAIRYRWALQLAMAVLFSAFITQVLKHTVFADVDRPAKFFEGVQEIYLIPGLENHLHNSFPSGHTTCAFALCFTLALIAKSRRLKFVYFLFALFIGYSRIYLSQHFFQDVYAGSIIGTATALFVYYFLEKNKSPWLERSLRKMRV